MVSDISIISSRTAELFIGLSNSHQEDSLSGIEFTDDCLSEELSKGTTFCTNKCAIS